MEAKSSLRSTKKNTHTVTGSVNAVDRKKSKSKKKRDKRKTLSLKGADSTDIPSPEFDCEVDQDRGCTPVGQVTKLPFLSSQSSVSLTTQVQLAVVDDPQPPRPSKCSSSQQHCNSASLTTTTAAIVVTGTASCVEGVVTRVASLNVKQRSSKQRSKSQAAKSSKAARNCKPAGNSSQSNAASPVKIVLKEQVASSVLSSNQSLRWEFVLADTQLERERMAEYKVNRRMRYLAAAQAKGLRWALNFNTQITASPTSEDSGVEMGGSSSAAYIDFETVKTAHSVPIAVPHRGLQQALVEC